MNKNSVAAFVLWSVFLTPVLSSFDVFDTNGKELQTQIENYTFNVRNVVSNSIRFKRTANNKGYTFDDEYIQWKQPVKESCCGNKSSVFVRFIDPDETFGEVCYEAIKPNLTTELTNYVQTTPSLFACNKKKLLGKIEYCVSECIGKKRGLLDADGNVILEVFKYVLNGEFTDEWQKGLAPKIIDTCFYDYDYQEWPAGEPGVKCNPKFLQFQDCLWTQYELSCPELEQKCSKECKKLRYLMRTQAPIKKTQTTKRKSRMDLTEQQLLGLAPENISRTQMPNKPRQTTTMNNLRPTTTTKPRLNPDELILDLHPSLDYP